jgi:hypothetical protein
MSELLQVLAEALFSFLGPWGGERLWWWRAGRDGPGLTPRIYNWSERGVPVHLELLPGALSGGQPLTVCKVRLPWGLPRFEMELRPRTLADGRSNEQYPLDIRAGDPAFHEAFVVAAAPENIARVLLDEDTRSALLTLRRCRAGATRGEIGIEVDGWISDAATARRLVDICVTWSLRLASITAYDHNAVEIAALHAALKERRWRRIGLVALVVAVVGVALLAWRLLSPTTFPEPPDG